MTDLMTDLETLSTKSNAAIVSWGAVLFDPRQNKISDDVAFYRRIDLDSVLELGAHVEQGTVMWWLDAERDAARAEAFNPTNRVHIAVAWHDFVSYCALNNVERIWSHGISFDIAILQNFTQAQGFQWPVHFRNNRDTRSVFDLVPAALIKGVYNETPPVAYANMVAHHPVYDSYVQARQVQAAYKYLGA